MPLLIADVQVVGCYFHFGQNVWRQLQADGKTTDYINDEEFATKVKTLMALAFIPPADVVQVFEQLSGLPEYQAVDNIISYLEDNCIGRERRGRNAQPRFPISLWNQYERVVQHLPRSNNSIEG